MLNSNFVYLAALFVIFGGYDYIVQTIKGKVKPNRVTWFLWTLAPMVAFFAEIQKGVGIQALMTFMVGFIPLLVLIASFLNKKSYWRLEKFDLVCGLLSLIGIFLWWLTKEGNIAIFFSILADGLAAAPTIVKSYRFPETESALAFFWFALNGAVTILTITNWNFQNYGFPVYILLVDFLIFILIKFKLGKRFADL